MVYLTEMTRWSLKWMLIVTNETENSQKQASAAWMADTVCSSPSLFALNSTSEQWSINMLSKWHTATLSLKHCHPVIWISTNICSALYSTKRSAWNAGHHGLDFTWTNAFFCKDMCQKWFLHFCPSDTILRSPKQQILLRTAICGGWCRRMALHNRELHARNNDDDAAYLQPHAV